MPSSKQSSIIKKFIAVPAVFGTYHFLWAWAGANIHQHSSKKIFVIGVTGTKGKTTTIELLNSILEAAGKETALLSSLRIKIGEKSERNRLGNSMPGRGYIQKFLKDAVRAKCGYAIVEVTSQGVHAHRHRFINWNMGVVTNLAPEHIESHGSFENYRTAKLDFLKYVLQKRGKVFLNRDDKNFGFFSDAISGDNRADYSKEDEWFSNYAPRTSPMRAVYGAHGTTENFLSSDFNKENAAAAVAVARELGVSDRVIEQALSAFTGVEGRMEFVKTENYSAVVDYAHTPDSLEAAYKAAKPKPSEDFSAPKLVCVLGAAGGGRDKWKRSEMGKIAAQYCDEIILTDEDSYDEDPKEIIDEIRKGIDEEGFSTEHVYEILDRKEAIRCAAGLSQKGDVVIGTGKGSEESIHGVRGKKIPWNEKNEFEKALEEKENGTLKYVVATDYLRGNKQESEANAAETHQLQSENIVSHKESSEEELPRSENEKATDDDNVLNLKEENDITEKSAVEESSEEDDHVSIEDMDFYQPDIKSEQSQKTETEADELQKNKTTEIAESDVLKVQKQDKEIESEPEKNFDSDSAQSITNKTDSPHEAWNSVIINEEEVSDSATDVISDNNQESNDKRSEKEITEDVLAQSSFSKTKSTIAKTYRKLFSTPTQGIMNSMKLTFYGGVGEVTGANYCLESSGMKIIIDCGLHQGSHYADKKNFEPFPYHPEDVSAVLITHSHLDHIGLLPKLVKDGFKGVIYSTTATKDFARIMLMDSEHILGSEAQREGRQPLYNDEDIDRMMTLWRGIGYHETIALGDFKITFFDAGHILGSAIIKIEAGGKTIVFSGDLGNTPAPIIRPTEMMTGADYCLVESAYGDRIHENLDRRRELLEDAIEETVKVGGVLMIPAFAMERTQELLYNLHGLLEEGRIPHVPVFIDSPLAIKLTEIYKKHDDYFNEETENIVKRGDDILSFPGVHFTLTTDQSKAINNVPPPKIIIAGSGMSNGGRILHHEMRYLSDPKNTILFVGYQAGGTLGREILDGAEEVTIFGEKVPVLCRKINILGYSAHADQPRLLKWVGNMKNTLKRVFVVQGEEASSAALAVKIRDEFAIEAEVPTPAEEISL